MLFSYFCLTHGATVRVNNRYQRVYLNCEYKPV